MEETEPLRAARAMRRAVLGDADVDTAALGRMEEFRLHASCMERVGVTDAELDELTFQIAAYCAAPAGLSARRELQALRAARQP